MRHFLTLADFTKEELLEILALSRSIKEEFKEARATPLMQGKILGMIFEKSSTRTRVSFEAGIYQLGGMGMFLSDRDLQLGRGEPIRDTARVISSMVDMVMIRTSGHERLVEFAQFSSVPVINGLTDRFHPVQLMADCLTILEEERENGLIVAYVGDGNNIAHSWMMLAAKLGFELRIATPKGYEPEAGVREEALAFSKESGAKIHFTHDPKEAVHGVTVVTTDTWASMGQEAQKAQRMRDFQGYCVDKALMNLAAKEAIFLHCLPAYRGQEVSEEVLEGVQSRVFREAENRLHVQKGIMVWLNQQRKKG